ncbi:glutaredoxin domain-containing protein [Thiobacillus sp.]|uniref:glutaredoxin family protein n=1 Tax=Thiobacillus sp. TaxID=924 RepID=UPI0011D95494|nr:glutaredoxin domain-containing protein [Thiobacillus sp.]TXH73959.1 MAG: NrdH-redoxin [Thiobacillus sp.]
MTGLGPGSEPIIVYTSPGCPDCAAVKHYLADRGIPFVERDITASGVAEEAKSRYGVRVAPITVIGHSFFYGTFVQQKAQFDLALAAR